MRSLFQLLILLSIGNCYLLIYYRLFLIIDFPDFTPFGTVPSGQRHWPCWHEDPPIQRSRPVGQGPSGGTEIYKNFQKKLIF